MAARLQLFGALRLTIQDRPVAMPPSRRARVLLALLALERRKHGRSELAGRLWPDVREESARVSLRTALVQLRAALGDAADAVLRTERDGVGLAPGVRTDVEEVEALLAAGNPEAALGRCSEQLLAGFDEDWAHERRDELRATLAAALGSAAATAEARGDHEAAVRLTRRQADLDPLAEAPHRDLIRRLVAAGDRGAALVVYERLRERLARELRITPSPATRGLVDRVRAERCGVTGAQRPRDGTPRLVGRSLERAELRRLLSDDGASVVFVCGLAGVGKSALLRAAAADAAADGATIVELDGAGIDPSRAGFAEAVSAALGASGMDPLDSARAVGDAGERVVVIIDAYERLEPLDEWLREAWLPALPQHVRVTIARRGSPAAAWSARYGPALAQIPLDSLPPSDAVELLHGLGVPTERALRLNRVLRGHPMALHLVAASRLPGAADTSAWPGIRELAELYLSGLDEPTRRALDAASVLRRVTVSLWTAMLPDADPSADFDRLRRLPFVWSGADGLIVFHVVRSAIAARLRADDPVRYRALRVAAWEQLRAELCLAPRDELRRYGADILYLSDDPAIQDAFFPNTAPFYVVGPSGPGDVGAVEAISRRHEPAAAVQLVRAWVQAAPETLAVARAQDDTVSGFSTVCDARSLTRRWLERDPVASAWRAHQRDRPQKDAGTTVCARHLLTATSGGAPDPVRAALLLDLLRRWLELGSRLRRVYVCTRVPAVFDALGFQSVDGSPTDLDGIPYHSSVLDLGERSAAGWLTEVVGKDLGLDRTTTPGSSGGP